MPIGGSVQDELLRLSGSTNNQFQTITVTTRGPAVYYGPGRLFDFRLLIAGTVSGTSPTLDVAIQESADGVTWATVASFPQATASQAVVTGSQAELPHVAVRTKDTKPYLSVLYTAGGTTPSFGSVAVLHSPMFDTPA